MNLKLQNRAFEIVAPHLQPGETPLAAARAMVGKFSAGRMGTALKQGLLLEAGGAIGAHLATAGAKQFPVVTDRRVFFLPQTFLGGPGKKILGEIPRDQVRLVEVQMGFMSLLRLAFGDQGDGLSLTFPRSDRKNAQALADALQTTPVA
ncbi:hypothetical protein AB0M54_14750 [Actinoplanes sp. NPDC051470]|uniref:hypothetical protein n=1 Tax=unclassified Actinoplanes TaxID=2626549 RepID=UPI0034263BD4